MKRKIKSVLGIFLLSILMVKNYSLSINNYDLHKIPLSNFYINQANEVDSFKYNFIKEGFRNSLVKDTILKRISIGKNQKIIFIKTKEVKYEHVKMGKN